jgi:hypothetical protein
MHGSLRIARGSSPRAAVKLRAWSERACRAPWLACIWATLVCSGAGAQQASYPVTTAPLALPPSLQLSNTTDRASGISPNLAQPTAVQPIGAASRYDSSAEVPGVLQPQFLITDQAGSDSTPSGSTATDRQTNPYDRTKQNDSANGRVGNTNDQSAWSLLWRQTIGNTQASAKASAGSTTAPQNASGGQSVWNELVVPPTRQASALPTTQSQPPNSFNPLARQLGFSDHTA